MDWRIGLRRYMSILANETGDLQMTSKWKFCPVLWIAPTRLFCKVTKKKVENLTPSCDCWTKDTQEMAKRTIEKIGWRYPSPIKNTFLGRIFENFMRNLCATGTVWVNTRQRKSVIWSCENCHHIGGVRSLSKKTNATMTNNGSALENFAETFLWMTFLNLWQTKFLRIPLRLERRRVATSSVSARRRRLKYFWLCMDA